MAQDESTNPKPADTLRGVCVALRVDLEVSRHVFRGSPAYIIRDPITFQSQRLDPDDYAILSRIKAETSLGATFDELVSEHRLDRDDEDRFYEFILSLHGLGFLRLPISDDRMLYRRHVLREQLRRREKISGFLFLRIPVWNPNAFLDRTIRLVRPLFGAPAMLLWCALLGFAAYVAVRNWSELINPIHGVLVSGNLVAMWVTLIVLKVFHEFGHAYACKHYGGHVPEMGIYLMMFTPCAYVDATAAWGFPKKRHRLFVSLAGMYVEMAMASVAMIVWAFTGPSLINSIAYNAIFLASAVTVLFNINPLMRYDGYYILCDLLEIPNLRARSARCLADQAKRVLLHIPTPPNEGGRRLTGILCGFGIAAFLYRITLMIAITALLASKMFLVGILLGVVMLGRALVSLVLRLTNYLWYAEETRGKRVRAVAISLVVLLILPAGLMWIPLQNNVYATGIARREDERIIRATTPGFVQQVHTRTGAYVRSGSTLAQLANDETIDFLVQAEAQVRASNIRRDAYRPDDPAKAAEEEAAARGIREQLRTAQQRTADLVVVSPINGQVIQTITDRDTGRYVARGEPLATIAAGPWQVRTILTAEQLSTARPRAGTPITFRPASDPSRVLVGEVVRVVPTGSHAVALEALTHLAGGTIAVDPATHQASEPYFELTATLSDAPVGSLRSGLTGKVRLQGEREAVGTSLVRRVVRFWNKLRRD